MRNKTFKKALCKTIAKYYLFSYEEIYKIYDKLGSIDKTIATVEIALANGISLEFAIEKLQFVITDDGMQILCPRCRDYVISVTFKKDKSATIECDNCGVFKIRDAKVTNW